MEDLDEQPWMKPPQEKDNRKAGPKHEAVCGESVPGVQDRGDTIGHEDERWTERPNGLLNVDSLANWAECPCCRSRIQRVAFSIDNRGSIGSHFLSKMSLETEKETGKRAPKQIHTGRYSPCDYGNSVVRKSRRRMPLLLAEQQRGGVRSGTRLQSDLGLQEPEKAMLLVHESPSSYSIWLSDGSVALTTYSVRSTEYHIGSRSSGGNSLEHLDASVDASLQRNSVDDHQPRRLSTIWMLRLLTGSARISAPGRRSKNTKRIDLMEAHNNTIRTMTGVTSRVPRALARGGVAATSSSGVGGCKQRKPQQVNQAAKGRPEWTNPPAAIREEQFSRSPEAVEEDGLPVIELLAAPVAARAGCKRCAVVGLGLAGLEVGRRKGPIDVTLCVERQRPPFGSAASDVIGGLRGNGGLDGVSVSPPELPLARCRLPIAGWLVVLLIPIVTKNSSAVAAEEGLVAVSYYGTALALPPLAARTEQPRPLSLFAFGLFSLPSPSFLAPTSSCLLFFSPPSNFIPHNPLTSHLLTLVPFYKLHLAQFSPSSHLSVSLT
ncbi:hypothetical protein PVAR5_0320 [Paecilomyces variotii No. 5]|uniref:Uncharacterized protein n=1 Tax=Byssochlamys spectabilis (strain No. 5 / NBRC 109023) TaxID=1356009 RepID=V5FQ61_BYSSN|nr:hypothetical protein PVAR5_0320 [Paecilomyces variotii No. 5]